MSQFLTESQFERVFKAHWREMYQAAYFKLKNHSQCEDLIQEVFVSLWERREKLQVQKNWRAYLLTAVKYQVMRNLVSVQRCEVSLDDYIEPAQQEEFLDLESLYSRIEVEIEKLPGRAGQIFRMNKLEGYTVDEIAEILNLAPQTVHNQLSIALKGLRSELKHISPLFFLFLHWPN